MVEKEFKRVLTEKQFLYLKRKIAGLKRVSQRNYYYDTKDLLLHKKDVTIRIRDINNKFKLQYKSKAIVKNNILTREEKEIMVHNIPFQLNPSMFGISDIENALFCLGNMTTIRYTKIENGIQICIDENHYLGIVDYELELECNDEMLIVEWLKENFKTNDCEICISSKYKRWIKRFENCCVDDIFTIFEKIANDNMEKAIIDENEKVISYSDLLNKAIMFSNYIIIKYGNKLTLNEPIGIFMDKSYRQIVIMLAALRIGIPFLPIDTDYPIERIEYLINNSNTRLIVCNNQPNINNSNGIFVIYDDIINDTKTPNELNFIYHSNINNIAYIMYTSGSTGSPKGVVIRQNSILNTLLWRIKYYNLNNNDKVLQMLSISFDSSIEDIFCSLLSGGCIVLINQKKKLNIKYLVSLIKKYNITYFLIVPSYYKCLLEKLDNNNSLTKVVLAGEIFYKDLVEKHFSVLKETRLYNEYGPTENSVCSTVCEIFNSEDITIGKPIDNVLVKIINKDYDGIGELIITGPGLFDGYLNDVDLTEEKIFYEDGLRWYLTGDLVKYDKNKNLVFVGRNDSQIKINGKKFNLSEIDSLLMNFPKIIFSKSICEKSNDIFTIITFVKCNTYNESIVTVDKINEYLKRYLPSDFLPHKIIFIKKVPLLSNGKIDFSELKKQLIGGEKK